MQVLSRLATKAVYGGDNPGMGPYAPPITQEMSNRIADLSFNALSFIGGAGVGSGIRYAGELMGITIPGLMGSTAAGAGALTPTVLNDLKVQFEQYTWQKLQIQNERNGFNKEGTEYTWPSGVRQQVSLNDAEQGDLQLAMSNRVVDNCEQGVPTSDNVIASALDDASASTDWASGLSMSGDDSGY